jgi:hypothetical protein
LPELTAFYERAVAAERVGDVDEARGESWLRWAELVPAPARPRLLSYAAATMDVA